MEKATEKSPTNVNLTLLFLCPNPQVVECSCRDDTNIENIFKAYLSLARVSLSATVSNNLNKKRPSNVPDSLDEQSSG